MLQTQNVLEVDLVELFALRVFECLNFLGVQPRVQLQHEPQLGKNLFSYTL